METSASFEARSAPLPYSTVGFMASKEGQEILDKYDFRSSHLVEGTRMAKYLRQSSIKLQEPKDSIAYYLQDEESGLQFKEELTRMLKQ
jgi:hypothetical protein